MSLRHLLNVAATLSVLAAGSCAAPELLEPLRVRVLLASGGPGDASINDGVIAGVLFANSGATFDTEAFAPSTDAEVVAKLDEWFADSGPRDLVVLGSGTYAPLLEARECDFGGARVLLVDGSVETCPDLRSVSFQSFAPAYLAGVAAVADPRLAPNARVAMIGGADVPPVRELLDGFRAGVEATGGEVAAERFVSDDPATGFGDPAAAAALVDELGDVDVIFVAAGRSAIGVGERLEAEARRAPRSEDRVWLIGSDTDQAARYGLSTVGSVLKRFDIIVRDAILEMVAGDLSSGDVVVGFRDRHTELLLHPRRAARVLSGDCAECDLFVPSCYQGCTTLEDVVHAEQPAAAAAAAEWRTR